MNQDEGPHIGSDGETPSFGTALAAALRAARVTQHQLAARLGTGQSTISAWVADRATPGPAMVFAVEQALDVAPGQLSLHLGYLPVGAGRPSTVADCLAVDPALTPTRREALTTIYRELVGQDAGPTPIDSHP